jgi:serine/threonine-protein kinase SRPK3
MSLTDDSGQLASDTFINWTGNIFNNRFILLEKLGYGACSSVWLSYDYNEDKCVAIKIFNLDDYTHGEYEVEMLKKINNLKSKYNVKFITNFDYETDNGTHFCIVLELLKCSLYTYCKTNRLNLNEIKIIGSQVLEFLKELNKAGMVHTDIKPENILIDEEPEIATKIKLFLKSDKFNNKILAKKKELLKNKKNDIKKVGIIAIKELILEEFYNNTNQNEESSESSYSSDIDDNKITEKFLDKYIFTRDLLEESNSDKSNDSNNSSDNVKDKEKFDLYSNDIKVKKIKVTDFNTCLYINKPDFEIQTRYYRAPEIILETNFSEKIDIWSLGCTLYEFLTREILFDPDDISEFSEDRYHIYLIHQKADIINKEMWDKSKKKYIYLDSNGLLKGFNNFKVEPFWISIFNEFEKSEKLLNFIDFLINCLQSEPTKRKTINDLLYHSFFLK